MENIYYTYNQTFLGFCVPFSQLTSEPECKMVRNFAPETEESIHSLCPTYIANKPNKPNLCDFYCHAPLYVSCTFASLKFTLLLRRTQTW